MGAPLRAERWTRSHFTFVAALIAFVGAAYGIAILLTPLTGGWLFVSACAAGVIGLRLGLNVTEDVGRTLRRLADLGSLEGDPSRLEDVIEERADSYAAVGGVVIAGLMLAVFSVTYWWVDAGAYPAAVRLFLTSCSTVGGYVVGRVLGRMVAVGRLGATIRSSDDWAIRPQRYSLDGAAGLAPVGWLYLNQAATLLVPAAFCALWWFVIPLVPAFESMFGGWRPVYLGLLALALLAQLFVFVQPMLSFHIQMKSWKDEVMRTTEQESARRLRELYSRLAVAEGPSDREAFKGEVTSIEEAYDSARRLPTWPLDVRTRRRFTIRNLVLLIPLIGQLGQENFLESLASAIGEIFS